MFNANKPPYHETMSAEDYIDNPTLYGLMKRLPDELVIFHGQKIESEKMTDDEAIAYIKSILKKRETATTVSEISDVEIQKYLIGKEEQIFEYIENELFFDEKRQIGNGMTAKVKLYEIQMGSLVVPTAIKYLVTPTSKTLSARGEHDMIVEVERIMEIERLEKKDTHRLSHIKVPHPYFHHKTEHIQCYGMEYIDGITLEQAVEGVWDDSEMKNDIMQSLREQNVEDILAEIDLFYDNMHEYCLHGDMKPANMMVDRSGKIFIIDFGQSILMSHIPDKAREQIEVLKEDERKISKDAIKRLFGLLN